MDADGQEILRKRAQALRQRRVECATIPDVDAFRGTMLVRADGTEYHYDGDWCDAGKVKEALERVRPYFELRRTLEECAIDGELTDQGTQYIALDDVVALMTRP